jgi:uncharacterized membrane protein YgdD (TMEM256/DUF423 family)
VSDVWRGADQAEGPEDQMIALLLLLVIAAIALGIVGAVVKGLLYLLIIGIVVFVGVLFVTALSMRRRSSKRSTR